MFLGCGVWGGWGLALLRCSVELQPDLLIRRKGRDVWLKLTHSVLDICLCVQSLERAGSKEYSRKWLRLEVCFFCCCGICKLLQSTWSTWSTHIDKRPTTGCLACSRLDSLTGITGSIQQKPSNPMLLCLTSATPLSPWSWSGPH